MLPDSELILITIVWIFSIALLEKVLLDSRKLNRGDVGARMGLVLLFTSLLVLWLWLL